MSTEETWLRDAPWRKIAGGKPLHHPDEGDHNSWNSVDLLYLAAVLSITFLSTRGILDLWWTWDDFFHLRFLAEHTPASWLFSAATWRELPFRMYTPMLFVSLELDRRLAGMRPEAFYLHHLISCCIAAALVYATARRWHRPGAAMAVAFLVLGGLPWIEIGQALMLRHYLEGLSFSCLALVALCRFTRERQKRWLFTAAGTYFLACLSKEIFVPAAIVFPLLVPSRARLQAFCGLGAAFGIYVALRLRMIGTLGGGYGWAVTLDSLPHLLITLPGKLLRAMDGDTASGRALAVLLFVFAVLQISRIRTSRLAAVVALVAAIVPIIPVSTVLERRYGASLWTLLVVAGVSGIETSGLGWRSRTALLSGLLVVAIPFHIGAWADSLGQQLRMSEEGRRFIRLGEGDHLRNPAIPPAAMGELEQLRKASGATGPGATWSYDDLYLCGGVTPRNIWEYDRNRRGVHDSSTVSWPRIRAFCSSLDETSPLQAWFRLRNGVLSWKFGPYARGTYHLVFGDGIQAFEMPREQSFHVGEVPELSLKVKHTAENGSAIYSPTITIARGPRSEVWWCRGCRPEAGR